MQTPPAAMQLGFAGLAPFFAAALLAAFGPLELARAGEAALLIYGGLILSFMGGCRWGFAAAGMGDGPSFRALALSVAPTLWAFAALGARFVEPQPLSTAGAAAALVLGFAALWASDLKAGLEGAAPDWWLVLRSPLTAGACAALTLGAAAAW